MQKNKFHSKKLSKYKIIQKPTKILQYFLGFIFIVAGFYRVFNFDMALIEFSNLHLPLSLIFPTIVLEITIGMLLLLDSKTKIAYVIGIIFLSIAITIVLTNNFNQIMKNFSELFIFNLNPTDTLLHITYLTIFIVLLLKEKLRS